METDRFPRPRRKILPLFNRVRSELDRRGPANAKLSSRLDDLKPGTGPHIQPKQNHEPRHVIKARVGPKPEEAAEPPTVRLEEMRPGEVYLLKTRPSSRASQELQSSSLLFDQDAVPPSDESGPQQ